MPILSWLTRDDDVRAAQRVPYRLLEEAPDRAWVTDITYIRTHEGFAYLAVVIDLFCRRVVGWSMQARQTTNVVL